MYVTRGEPMSLSRIIPCVCIDVPAYQNTFFVVLDTRSFREHKRYGDSRGFYRANWGINRAFTPFIP